MQIVEGDLVQYALDGHCDVIVHGCNCLHRMERGVALAIKNEFPEVFEADLTTQSGDRLKLGTYSMVSVMRDAHEIIIVNAYTQYNYMGSGVLVDYDALRSVFKLIKQDFTGLRLAYPKIGAGLARGSWDVISNIIETELDGEDHTLVVHTE